MFAFLFAPQKIDYTLSLKYIICSYTNECKMFDYVLNFYILHGKYYINRKKVAKSALNCNLFLLEMKTF